MQLSGSGHQGRQVCHPHPECPLVIDFLPSDHFLRLPPVPINSRESIRAIVLFVGGGADEKSPILKEVLRTVSVSMHIR